MPKITIITIVFNNREGFIKTLNSVVSQTYKNKEYLVVDGGSTDGTLDVIKHNLNFIDYWVSEKDRGIYDAMNKGLAKANGEWVIFMNSGDVFSESDVLSKIFDSTIRENVDLIYSDYYTEGDGLKMLNKSDAASGKFMHQSIIYKKDLHNQFGYYLVTKPLIISDFLFLASIPLEKKFKTNVVICTIQPGGISQQGMWAMSQMACGQHIFFQESIFHTILALLKCLIIDSTPQFIKRLIKLFF